MTKLLYFLILFIVWTPLRVIAHPYPIDSNTLFSLPFLRFYIDDSPGLGHQAHTNLLIRHFREAGYRGEIEILYLSPEKVSPFFPSFDPEANIQADPINNITFVRLNHSPLLWDRHPPSPPLRHSPLTISGGEDSAQFDTGYLRQMLRSNSLLVLNPYLWSAESYIQNVDGRRVNLDSVELAYTPSTGFQWQGESIDSSLVSRLESYMSTHQVIPFYSHIDSVASSLIRLTQALNDAKVGSVIIPVFNNVSEEEKKRILRALDSMYNQQANQVNIQFIGTIDHLTFNEIFFEIGAPLVIVSGQNSIAMAMESSQPFLESQPLLSAYEDIHVQPLYQEALGNMKRAHEDLNYEFSTSHLTHFLHQILTSDQSALGLYDEFRRFLLAQPNKLMTGLQRAQNQLDFWDSNPGDSLMCRALFAY